MSGMNVLRGPDRRQRESRHHMLWPPDFAPSPCVTECFRLGLRKRAALLLEENVVRGIRIKGRIKVDKRRRSHL